MDCPAKPSNASEESNENPLFHDAPDDDDNKRRSLSRSIKRRRFNDELVEYSLGVPGASLGKEWQMADLASTSALVVPAHPPQEREESGDGIVTHKAHRKRRLSNLSTKDFGRWDPTDDLALIVGVQQTNDLRTVHRDIQFSGRFTLSELESRWHALLYNAEISGLATAAVHNLHPALVAAVQQQALYSNAEEDLLGTLLSTSHPTEDIFQELLEQNTHVFYFSRTPKILMAHWQQLKQYQLLPDQSVQPLSKNPNGKVLSFSDAEDTLNNSELSDSKEEGMDVEMEIADGIDSGITMANISAVCGQWQHRVSQEYTCGTMWKNRMLPDAFQRNHYWQ